MNVTVTFIKSCFIAPSVHSTKMENVRLFWKKIRNISCCLTKIWFKLKIKLKPSLW